MAETKNEDKETLPSTVVNEDEETDIKEASAASAKEKDDEEMVDASADGEKGADDKDKKTEDDVNDEEQEKGDDEEMEEDNNPKEKSHGGRTYNNPRYSRGGRGGRGGRHARRHVPYRSHNNNNNDGDNSDRTRRVYVGNLSWDVTWRELKDYMKTTGCEVTRADVMLAHDGRSKGCGIVEFATADGARRAVLTLNDTELYGRQIFVREDREDGFGGGGGGGRSEKGHHAAPSGDAQSRRVYVGNIPWDVAWQDLKDHMRQAGEVLFAEVLKNPDGRSKGCGIVEYSQPSEAQEAISLLNDSELNGRMIFVREDRENTNASATSHDSDDEEHNDNAPHTHANTNNSATSVYVGNVSFECSWQDLKDHMRQAGNVDQANILHYEDGRSKGCAIVTYQKPQEAQRAIRELQNTVVHGRPIFVREDREQSSTQTTQPLQLFVGNLSYDTNWRDLKHHFRQCGEVERAEVMEGPDGRKRGYGTVRFYRSRDAQSAIRRLNGDEFMGRRLEVRVDHKAND